MKADAANPRPVAGAAPGLPPPFLGGGGMMPACPKSLATVSEGCAPTESQYLSKAREGRAGGSVASEGRGRHGTLRSRRGGTGRKLTSRGRSSARGACFRRSLSGGGRRARQSMRARGVNAMDGVGAAGGRCGWADGRTRLGIVVPHDFEVPPVPRRSRVRHVYPIERMVPVPVASESNPHRHVVPSTGRAPSSARERV